MPFNFFYKPVERVLPRFNSSFFDDVLDDTNEKAPTVGFLIELQARQYRKEVSNDQCDLGVLHACFRTRNEELIGQVG